MAVNLNKDIVYKSAKAKEKDYSINDDGGLYLFVLANGSKLWRFIYTFQGKRKKIAFGAYPNTSTELARIKAVDALENIAQAIDPSEIRKMLWTDIDLDAKEWRLYVSKTDFHHIVPLSRQAVEILVWIQPLTGTGQYVFPSSRGDGQTMSENTIMTALKSLGYDTNVMPPMTSERRHQRYSTNKDGVQTPSSDNYHTPPKTKSGPHITGRNTWNSVDA